NPHFFLFSNDTFTNNRYSLSLHDALPIFYSFNNGRIEGINNKIKVLNRVAYGYRNFSHYKKHIMIHIKFKTRETKSEIAITVCKDRKSTRLNSSHVSISYAVFCLTTKTIK